MDKIVIKRLIIQISIVILILAFSFVVVNKVFGTNTIKYEVASDPRSNIKELVIITSVIDGKPNQTVTTNNGYLLLEKEGFINPYKINGTSTILFYGNPLNNERGIYIIDTDTYKITDISKEIQFPIDIYSFPTVNFSNISNSFCFFIKESKNKVNCYSLDLKTNKVSIVNTDEINKLLTNITSDKYSLVNSFNVVSETDKSKYGENILIYSIDGTTVDSLNLLSFNVSGDNVSIISNDLKDHIFDNVNVSKTFPSSYEGIDLNNITPISLISNVQSLGTQFIESSKSEEYLSTDCADKCPHISNPIIGSQYIEYNGTKYLEWLSTYNFNSIKAGMFENHTIYAKVNDSIYLIDTKTKSVYKVNSKKDFTNMLNISLFNY